MRTLYIIDGYAQFFRAYHAIRTPMSSPVTGEPTNLTFGFVGLLLKLLRGEGLAADGPNSRPDYLAVALDVSGDRGTFRSVLYPEYKATRPPPPEDLPQQVKRCLKILEAVGVPLLGAEGFEADDVIATMVRRLRKEQPDLRIRIVSKDKDLKQLLEAGRVELYDAHKDEVITADTLKEETGLTPDRVIDMLALMGDSIDNVPGVEGVGPKTAAKLIADYGSLDELLARADEIKGKRGEKLREAAGRLDLSRRLVTLRDDVELDIDLGRAETDALHPEALAPILRELGFNRYQDELKALLGGESPTEGSPAGPDSRPAPRSSARTEPGGLFDSVEQTRIERTETAGDYRRVRTTQELDALVKVLERAPVFSVDTETTGLSPMRADLCGLSFSIRAGSGWYVPVRSPEPESHLDERTVLDALRPLLEDPEKPKYGHNLKYDLLVLRRAGVELRGLSNPASCDSMIASYLIDASRSSHSMDALALALLNHQTISIKDLIGSGKLKRTFDTVPLDAATDYAAEDADITLRLCSLMRPKLAEMGLDRLASTLEMPLVEVLAELEYNGVLVDPNELDRQRERLETQIAGLKRKIQDAAMEEAGRSFDPDSPKQLAGVLFNKPEADEPGLGLRPLRRGKTGPSTDAEVLDKLASAPEIATPIPGLILEYRQLTKLVNTYLGALKDEINPETKRIHASFNQTVAATGRLSSSDPNLQNIPIRTDIGREIRRAFVAPPGRVLVTADYSQIELRLLAHLSRDPALIEAFRRDDDIHTAVAAQIHGVKPEEVTREQRGGAKMVNFGIVYGITPYGLARRLGVGNDEAAAIIDGYKRRFAGITTFLQECIEYARGHGYVETMLKRRRPITEIDATNPQRRALAERMAINSVVQGSAADLIKIAMVDLHARLSEHAAHLRGGKTPEVPGVRMLLQIHDELVFEAPEEHAQEALALITSRMESAMSLDAPLKVEAGIATNWYESK